MKVRFDGHYCICECGMTMMYLDGMDVRGPRRIVCPNAGCEHCEVLFFEPLFEVHRVGLNLGGFGLVPITSEEVE